MLRTFRRLRGSLVAVAGVWPLCVALGCSPTADELAPVSVDAVPALDLVRISYPMKDGVFMWGMVAAVLERTDLLARNGIRGGFVRCPDSPAHGRSIVYGDADVALITTGNMGVTMICGRPYKITSTLGAGGRNALIVPSGSPIRSIPELRGRRVENPVLGGLLERFLTGAGVAPEEVRIAEQYEYEGGSVERLLAGESDALMYWDPYLVPLLRDGRVRILTQDPYHLEVAMLDAFLRERPELAERFLVALMQALAWVLADPEQAAAWYEQTAGVPQQDVIEALDFVEVVAWAREHPGIEGVRIASTPQQLADVRGVIGAMGRFGVFQDLRPKICSLGLPDAQPLPQDELDVEQFLDVEVAARAEARFRAQGFDPASVRVTGLDPDALWLRCQGER